MRDKGPVNLFDHPTGGDTFLKIILEDLKDLLGSIALFALVYVILCFIFSFQAGNEYRGPYMSLWHWPLKTLISVYF